MDYFEILKRLKEIKETLNKFGELSDPTNPLSRLLDFADVNTEAGSQLSKLITDIEKGG